MGDDKLPKIPSFAELGISEDEIEELEREIAEEAAGRKEEGGKAGAAEGPSAGAPPAAGGRRTGGRDAGPGAAPAKEPGAATASRGGAGQAATGRQRIVRRKSGSRAGRRSVLRSGHPASGRPPAAAAAAPAAAPTPAKAPTPPPWGGLRGPATLFLLLITAWFSSSYRTIPSPVPASAPDSVFSSARAMSHLARIASEGAAPRFSQSRPHARLPDRPARRARPRPVRPDGHLVSGDIHHGRHGSQCPRPDSRD